MKSDLSAALMLVHDLVQALAMLSPEERCEVLNVVAHEIISTGIGTDNATPLLHSSYPELRVGDPVYVLPWEGTALEIPHSALVGDCAVLEIDDSPPYHVRVRDSNPKWRGVFWLKRSHVRRMLLEETDVCCPCGAALDWAVLRIEAPRVIVHCRGCDLVWRKAALGRAYAAGVVI